MISLRETTPPTKRQLGSETPRLTAAASTPSNSSLRNRNKNSSFASLQNPKTSCPPAPSPEDDRDFKEDIEEFGENVETTLTNTWNKIYGSQCQTDDQVREA